MGNKAKKLYPIYYKLRRSDNKLIAYSNKTRGVKKRFIWIWDLEDINECNKDLCVLCLPDYLRNKISLLDILKNTHALKNGECYGMDIN